MTNDGESPGIAPSAPRLAQSRVHAGGVRQRSRRDPHRKRRLHDFGAHGPVAHHPGQGLQQPPQVVVATRHDRGKHPRGAPRTSIAIASVSVCSWMSCRASAQPRCASITASGDPEAAKHLPSAGRTARPLGERAPPPRDFDAVLEDGADAQERLERVRQRNDLARTASPRAERRGEPVVQAVHQELTSSAPTPDHGCRKSRSRTRSSDRTSSGGSHGGPPTARPMSRLRCVPPAAARRGRHPPGGPCRC